MRPIALLVLVLSLSACTSASGPVTEPNDREWNLLSADYQWIETLRKAQPAPSSAPNRKQEIEIALENHRKLEPTFVPFLDKVREYYDRTHDPRAAKLLAREKIIMGDEYMSLLSRYDRAIDAYQAALQIDPENADARARLAAAESRRFVTLDAFSTVRSGMKEEEVRKAVGLPREDWIKQVMQSGRAYSVWIYPKSDGGASAIYFDNGVVYHTNWNAAPAPASSAAPAKSGAAQGN